MVGLGCDERGQRLGARESGRIGPLLRSDGSRWGMPCRRRPLAWLARRFAAAPPFTLPAAAPPARLARPHPVSPALHLGGDGLGDRTAIAQRTTTARVEGAGGRRPTGRFPEPTTGSHPLPLHLRACGFTSVPITPASSSRS